DDGVADHAGAHPVIGVAAAEILLQQFDAERLDLVDVFRASEPSIDRADMALRRASAYLGREKCTNAGAGRRFGCQQVDALLTAPAGVAADGGNDLTAHGFRIFGRIDERARLGQRILVMDLEGIVVDPWGLLLHRALPFQSAAPTLARHRM